MMPVDRHTVRRSDFQTRYPRPESIILTSQDSHALPPPSTLERTLDSLLKARDWRKIVGAVHAWAEMGEPSERARQTQAAAFEALCLIDHAWFAIEPLVRNDTASVETLKSGVRLNVDRGDRSEAARCLAKLREAAPDDPEVEPLADLLSSNPTSPDLDPESNDPKVRLLLAEQHLRQGRYVKAKGLLEWLRRHHQEADRVADLQWAIEGDFALPGTLADLVEAKPSLWPTTLPDFVDEAEHTESVRKADLADAMSPPERSKAFPSLFRGLGSGTETYPGEMTPEVTSVAGVPTLTDHTDAPSLELAGRGTREDTEVMHVQKRDGLAGDTTQSVKLSELSQGLGDELSSDWDLGPETEDAGVVQFTHKRREAARLDPESLIGIKLDLDVEAAASGKVDEASAWAKPTPEPKRKKRPSEVDTLIEEAPAEPAPVPKSPPKPAKSVPSRTSRKGSSLWWVAVLGLVFLVAGAGLLVIAVLSILTAT